jgi:endonuclease/exonuclease/phosphatase family metal-dependent hydrolase
MITSNHRINSTAHFAGKRFAFIALLCLIFSQSIFSQALPIAIDSRFDDWAATAVLLEDKTGDGNSIDLLRFAVANDDEFLFLRLEIDQEVNLTENNNLTLFLDADHDAATGKSFNGIGAELEIRMGERLVIYYSSVLPLFLYLNDVQFRHQPTVSSSQFEIAIGRAVAPDGVTPLFSGGNIRLAFRDGLGGDLMPDAGQTFTYTFDETPVLPYEGVSLEKENPKFLRLMTWNTSQDGLDDVMRQANFKRITTAIQPDIVTFNECWDLFPSQAATFMNAAFPLPNFQNWHAVKLDQGNVTVSRYPISKNWLIYPGHRLTASLIDLPDAVYEKDLLVINAHLKCCSDGNSIRQNEADAFAAFILDAKTPGGVIDLPEDTPFVLSGDLNLVGSNQQLKTLLEGSIVNTGTFGQGGAPDWDDTELEDGIALQADARMAYTWRKESSEFPPSRIDYHIFPNSVMNAEKFFSLRTEDMSPERLAMYGLLQNDTHTASDHLPKVTDFSLPTWTGVAGSAGASFPMRVSPTPFENRFRVEMEVETGSSVDLSLFNLAGIRVAGEQANVLPGRQTVVVEAADLPAGMYLLKATVAGKSGGILVFKK